MTIWIFFVVTPALIRKTGGLELFELFAVIARLSFCLFYITEGGEAISLNQTCGRFEKWIPAFAGMTNIEITTPFNLRSQWLAMTVKVSLFFSMELKEFSCHMLQYPYTYDDARYKPPLGSLFFDR